MIEDKTEVYYIKYCVFPDHIYVDLFHIERMYRGRGYSCELLSSLEGGSFKLNLNFKHFIACA